MVPLVKGYKSAHNQMLFVVSKDLAENKIIS